MGKQLDVNQIMELIPHRYPFLLVDRILDFDKKKIVGIKNVSINEPFFQGHFPGHPIMPGVLQVEGLAQTAGCLIFQDIPDRENKVVYFASFDNVKFRKPVFPGDTITYEVDVLRFAGKIAKLKGRVLVEGQEACTADMMAIIQPRAGSEPDAG